MYLSMPGSKQMEGCPERVTFSCSVQNREAEQHVWGHPARQGKRPYLEISMLLLTLFRLLLCSSPILMCSNTPLNMLLEGVALWPNQEAWHRQGGLWGRVEDGFFLAAMNL